MCFRPVLFLVFSSSLSGDLMYMYTTWDIMQRVYLHQNIYPDIIILVQTAVIVVQTTAVLRPRRNINKCTGISTFLSYNTNTELPGAEENCTVLLTVIQLTQYNFYV